MQGVATVGPGDDAMMAYGGTTAGNGGAMGPSSGGAGPASYSPQDSPASSAGGGGGSGGNGQLPSFGFTQEQVACVCEVSLSPIR